MEPFLQAGTVRRAFQYAIISLLMTSLPSKLGPRLKVVGLIDPNIERAAAALEKKCESFVVTAYQDTHICKTLADFIRVMSPGEKPHAVIVGSPPMFRGILQKGRDIEAQILEHFPGVPLFVEKPITTGPLEELNETHQLAKRISDSKTICSVGYAELTRSLTWLGPLTRWAVGICCDT